MLLQDTDDLQVVSIQDFAQSLPGKFLNSGLNPQVLRPHKTLHNNAMLLKGEWEHLDARIHEVSHTILVGISDLQAAGLTINTGGLGAMLTMYQQGGDMSDASVNMSPDVDIEEDRLDYQLVALPVPIIAKAFRLNIRELSASRQHGGGLDTSHADAATRKVAEKQEQILFQGSTIVVQGNRIYGYMNHPDRNTVSGADWGTASNIYANVVSALGALTGDGHTGPFRLYLHSDQYLETLAFMPTTTTSYLSALQQLPGFGPGAVKIAGTIPSGQAILLNLSSDVVDLAIGQDTIPVEWDTRGGMVTRYLVFSCLVPRVKSASDKKSGIAHLTGI